MRILLVDSDTEARTAIVLWLDEFFAHVEIEAAASAVEAVIALQKRMPDLVITAHAIPGLNGIALASIVNHGRTRHQSWCSPPDAAAALTSGLRSATCKPCYSISSSAGSRKHGREAWPRERWPARTDAASDAILLARPAAATRPARPGRARCGARDAQVPGTRSTREGQERRIPEGMAQAPQYLPTIRAPP